MCEHCDKAQLKRRGSGRGIASRIAPFSALSSSLVQEGSLRRSQDSPYLERYCARANTSNLSSDNTAPRPSKSGTKTHRLRCSCSYAGANARAQERSRRFTVSSRWYRRIRITMPGFILRLTSPKWSPAVGRPVCGRCATVVSHRRAALGVP
jgi:hypothetical protein